MMADTGADVTMIRRHVAVELGLRVLGSVEVHHFAGPSRPYRYLAMFGCTGCDQWRPVELVDDFGVNHPDSIEFPEVLLGRDVLQYASFAFDGPAGSWSLNVHFEDWPKEVTPIGPQR